MPKLAHKIEVVRRGYIFTLLIDGAQFPWLISEFGVSTTVDNGVPTVTLNLPAEIVVVDNELSQDTMTAPPSGYQEPPGAP